MHIRKILTNSLAFHSACEWAATCPTINGVRMTNIEEKKWGNTIIGDNHNNQWTTKLGQALVFECLEQLGENPRMPKKKNHYLPDIETDDFIYEVKTRSWTTSGTAGEKVYGTPLKYAEIPLLYGKPLIIVCVAYQEYELLFGNTPIFGEHVRDMQEEFLDFYKQHNIEFEQCTKLVELLSKTN
jgi:hypothetical protein